MSLFVGYESVVLTRLILLQAQAAAIHEDARLLRLAQDVSNAAIVLVTVQGVRANAAASVMSIRFSDYGDAQTDLQNQEAGWSVSLFRRFFYVLLFHY